MQNISIGCLGLLLFTVQTQQGFADENTTSTKEIQAELDAFREGLFREGLFPEILEGLFRDDDI